MFAIFSAAILPIYEAYTAESTHEKIEANEENDWTVLFNDVLQHGGPNTVFVLTSYTSHIFMQYINSDNTIDNILGVDKAKETFVEMPWFIIMSQKNPNSHDDVADSFEKAIGFTINNKLVTRGIKNSSIFKDGILYSTRTDLSNALKDILNNAKPSFDKIVVISNAYDEKDYSLGAEIIEDLKKKGMYSTVHYIASEARSCAIIDYHKKIHQDGM